MVRPPRTLRPRIVSRYVQIKLTGRLRSTRLTAHLGLYLGIAFGICFATGVLSHYIQHPPGWFHWTSRPVQLYRVTQGLHIATGLASIPLLTAKVWSVFPKLFGWPPFRSLPHALERLSIVVLSGGSVFELLTGLLNITYWYGAMPFAFSAAHYWMAWTVIGALLVHIAVKLPVIRRALGEKPAPATGNGLSRRGVLAIIGTAAGAITIATVGETVRPLRHLSLLAPRLPDVGPQGIPVNRTAHDAQVNVDDTYRLVLTGPRGTRMLRLADLQALPQHTVALPIACVEGWSTGAKWTGVRFVDLLTLVGAGGTGHRVLVESLERGGPNSASHLESGQAADPLTVLALRMNGEELHPDHGYPCRLIGPNRPGVQQTKWVAKVTVL